MKKTAKVIFAVLLTFFMCGCALALTLEPVENITDSGNELLGTLSASEIKTFDPVKGDLVYKFTFDTGKFLNFDYVTNATSIAGRLDGTSLAQNVNDNGDIVLELTSTGGAAQLFGYGVNYNEKTVGGKATIEFDFKYISSASKFNQNNSFMRILKGNATDFIADGPDGAYFSRKLISWPPNCTEGQWYHASVTTIDTERNGLRGGIIQYSGLASEKLVQYIDDYSFYVYPEKTFAILEAKGSENCERITASGDTYTFEAKEGVVAYTDGTNYYKPGIAYNVSDLQFKALYPYCQDASKPAVALAFEGNKDIGEGYFYTQGYKYRENIVDDGRDVFHIVYRDANKGDLRIRVMPEAQFAISEYNILSFMVKPDEAWTTATQPDATADMMFYAHSNQWGHFASNTFVFSYPVPVSDNYTYMESDLSGNANWNNNAGGYGFEIDIFNNSNYGGSTHIDYIRVYRAGITTVTYDTNAPAGATVLSEVPADKNRGVGKGYLLKGMRPAVEGYKFMGWALTPDATVADVIESFDLIGDTTVYAVWSKDNGTINAKEKAEMRFGDTTTGSIRFKADVLANQRDDAEEYGFIVARLSHLTAYNKALTHNFINRTKSTRTPLYVEGVAYKRGGDIDTFYEKNENTGDIYISAACTNIPLSEIGVNDKLVARPYYKYRINGKAVYVYGTAAEASLGDVAGAVDTSSSDYIRNKDYIDGILGLVKAD